MGCKHHLYLDVRRLGDIQFNFPKLAVEDLKESCALDVAAHGSQTLEKVGELLNITRERVRQIVEAAIQKGGRVARTQGFKNPYKEETSDPYTWRKAY